MWRGVTRHAPILDGRTNCRIGALQTGKLVIYPIRNHPDGTQLVNWVVEVPMQAGHRHGWASPGRLEDFAARFARWRFDWLDIPALLEQAQMILEYPMVDRDPLPRWSFGRVSLLGDAAHPMVPRGGNGAAQAILDAQALAGHLSGTADPVGALRAYEAERLPRTTAVVNASRTEPPDTLISRVEALTGGRPFERIEAVIDPAELAGIADRYALTAGYDLASANQPATLPGAEPPGALPRPARR
jgi:2-polyprenyl-6-methoxyphenol hydroxylase-like FAD-dependent oxidoreductase